MKAVCAALMAVFLVPGCTIADLKGYQNKVEQVTIDAAVLSASQVQMHRLESERLRWDLMKEAAEQIAEAGHPLAAVQVLDCYFYSRQPLYLTRVIQWIATINGEIDGVKVAHPYSVTLPDGAVITGQMPPPWECELPKEVAMPPAS